MLQQNSLQCAACFHVQDGGNFCVDCGHNNLTPFDYASEFGMNDDASGLHNVDDYDTETDYEEMGHYWDDIQEWPEDYAF